MHPYKLIKMLAMMSIIIKMHRLISLLVSAEPVKEMWTAAE